MALVTIGGLLAYGILTYMIMVFPAIELGRKFGFAYGIGYLLLVIITACVAQKIGYFN